MKRAVWAIAMMLAALLMSGVPLFAQGEGPLIITLNGDLWNWSGDTNVPPIALTTWGFNDPPALSPDGTRAAYSSVAQVVVTTIQQVGAVGGGALPSNIWVIDIASGDGFRAADQPPDAVFMDPAQGTRGIVRSDPVWSPNGAQLAWGELAIPEMSGSVIVYDVGGGARAIAAGLPPSAGVPNPPAVQWGQSGLFVRSDELGTDGRLFTLMTVYSPEGSQLASFALGDGARTPSFYAPMDANGREWLGVLFNDGVWELYDPFSGGAQIAPGIPEMYSRRAPDSSLALSPVINDVGGFTWRVLDPGGSILAEFVSAPFFIPERYALSPSGQAVAFSEYLPDQRVFGDWISVWQGGAVTTIPNPVNFPLIGGVAWGHVGWRVRPGIG